MQKDNPEALAAPLDAQGKARILSEALPYMQRYDDATVVVKYGGHAMGDEALARSFAQDIVMLKQSGVNPVVVHGGGPQIGALLEKLNIQSVFEGGLRVTDKATVDVVEMVLAGAINKQIVAAINQEGGKAVGICGKDAGLMIARKLERKVRDPGSNIERVVDLGYVGEPDKVNPHIIDVIIRSDLIPVVAPVSLSAAGETLNINADTFASALAAAMKAKRLLLLTDVSGVL
ncbi:MAG: acetylglutamate kinase, partial [Hyphomicrobiales bacterium]